MSKRSLFVTLVVTLMAAALAVPAAANPPDKQSFHSDLQATLTGVCSFPITVDSSADAVATLFFDSSGTPVRLTFHFHGQDVFSANGISLPGVPYTSSVDVDLAPDGTVTAGKSVGIQGKIRLPDGTLFIVAGFSDLLTVPPGQQGGFILFVTHGNPGDTTALCAALTP
jgi:hypothetical protein